MDNRSSSCRSFTFDLNNNKRGIAVRHIENYEGVVDFPLFKKFLQFEDENIYFFADPIEWKLSKYDAASHVNTHNVDLCHSKYFLYFEICLHGNLKERFNLKIGFSDDKDWRNFGDANLINEIGYEENLDDVWRQWNSGTNSMHTHPAERESNFFDVDISTLCQIHKGHTVSGTSNVVGCGWDLENGKMFMCINGKYAKERSVTKVGSCTLRPGFSFNQNSFKNILKISGAETCKFEMNCGRKPFVYAPAWKEKLERTQVLSMRPSLKKHIGFSIKDKDICCWASNDTLKQWCQAAKDWSERKPLGQDQLKILSVYPMIHSILDNDLDRVKKIVEMTGGQCIFGKDNSVTNHLTHVETADARSLVNQQYGFCLSTWSVEPSKRTVIHIASLSSISILKYLVSLQGGTDALVIRDADGCTPLHVAARVGNYEAVEYLCNLCISRAPEGNERDTALKRLFEVKSNGGMNMLHHAILSGCMKTADYILKHHYRIFEHFSTDGHQVFDPEENDNLSWSMLKSAPIHYCVYAACGILPAGTPYLNITSYFTMMQKSAGERVQVMIALCQKLCAISEKSFIKRI